MKPFSKFNALMTTFVAVGSICVCSFALVIVFWALDREPPFKVLDYKISQAKAGESTVIRATVHRDLDRRCSVMISRMFIDSTGTRFDLTEGAQFMNARALEEYSRRSPNMLNVSVAVPKSAALGTANVMTVLDYECNPVQQVYPIPMVVNFDLEVIGS